jgi:hypothetical protein
VFWLKSSPERRRRARILLPAATLALCAGLLWHFHDRSWYPVDDGNYAHVAERVANGQVLNRDVQDIHAGYVNFLNAAALRLFGPDLVSLRYPLLLAALVQAALLLRLLATRDAVVASAATVAATSLGVVQFFNPTAHWYCAALTVTLAFWMVRVPSDWQWRLVGAGILVGTVALFRQLTGLWVGMAVLSIALAEASEETDGHGRLLSQGLLAAMLVTIVAYSMATREWLGALLIASTPAAILAWMLFNVRVGNREAAAVVVRIGGGAILPALPLLAYHVVHGSVGSWLDDVVGTAVGLTGLGFFGQPWYAAAIVAGLHEVATSFNPTKVINGMYWAVLPLLPLVAGAGLIRRLRSTSAVRDLSFPILTAFYSLVSLHFQIPIYLYYSSGLCLAAILWLNAGRPPAQRYAWCAGALALGAVGLIFHAAQPYTRTSVEILHGVRRTGSLVNGFERCRLLLDPGDREKYRRLVSLIEREVPVDGYIFAVPSNAELYFLANRRNPFRFYNTALGIRNADELASVIDVLARRPPLLVTYRADDKYNTEASRAIMEHVRGSYDRLETIDSFEVYRLRHPG